jgi:dTDP-4-dehydrorhamnose 3,5-epimerase
MIIKKLKFDGLFLIKPKIIKDKRGFFFEKLRINELSKTLNKKIVFVQENVSLSKKNVFRGLHFQKKPYSQSKLITVIKGSILDVVININKKSKFYKKKFLIKLDSRKYESFFVSNDYAHGFLSLENNTIIKYQVDKYYNKQSEGNININEIKINKILKKYNLIISNKDQKETKFLISKISK